MKYIDPSERNSKIYLEGYRAKNFTPRLIIDHEYTADRVEMHADGCGWSCTPEPPDASSAWVIFDFSPDSKTGWRRISLECGGQES
jgi:hypothetical protein